MSKNTKLDKSLLLAGAILPVVALRRKAAEKKEAREEKKTEAPVQPKPVVA